MNKILDQGFGFLGSVVGLAVIATLVSPRAQTSKVAKAIGDVVVGSIKAAKDLDG